MKRLQSFSSLSPPPPPPPPLVYTQQADEALSVILHRLHYKPFAATAATAATTTPEAEEATATTATTATAATATSLRGPPPTTKPPKQEGTGQQEEREQAQAAAAAAAAAEKDGSGGVDADADKADPVRANLALIRAHNARPDVTYSLAANRFLHVRPQAFFECVCVGVFGGGGVGCRGRHASPHTYIHTYSPPT